MTDETIAIIPARAGSKGIPGKNLMRLAGKSILQWTVETASAILGHDRVVVSSDGDEILQEAQRLGVRGHRRTADVSTDTASSESAILQCMEHLTQQGVAYRRVLFMQCTSPCTAPEDLRGLIQTFETDTLDSCFTATESHAFLWRKSADGSAIGVNHEPPLRPMRQQREPEYRENGAAYLMDATGLRQARRRFLGKIGLHCMPLLRSFEIDSLEDARLIEEILTSERSRESPTSWDWCRAIVFDFDGVLTDNGVTTDENGTESVRCDRRDGMGFEFARHAGLRTLILSKEKNKVVAERAKKLKCEVIQGVDDKPTILNQWLHNQGLAWHDIAYVGNDVNDLECIRRAKCGVAVADALPSVRREADWLLSQRGGHGAVREMLDHVIATRVNLNFQSETTNV